MNNPIYFSVEEILDDIFFDEVEKSIQQLKDYKLFDIVEQSLQYLKKKNDDKSKIDFDTITISFLQTVNNILHDIEDLEIRNDLKYILSNIGNYIIDAFTNMNVLTLDEIISLRDSLISLSEVKGYSFNDIDCHLQINRLIRKMDISSSENRNVISLVHYEWLGADYKLDEISRDLYSEKVIKSVLKFKKLFSVKPEVFEVYFSKKDFIFVLFDTLHEKKLIKAKGKKGKFIALCQYAIDLEKEKLFKKNPKYIKQQIKSNSKNYLKLKAKAEKWSQSE